jgi:hypothetical protein
MATKVDRMLVKEYHQLRIKLDNETIKTDEFNRLVQVENLLINIFHYTWDEMFDAQFGIYH